MEIHIGKYDFEFYVEDDDALASCGMEIRKSEGYVCPYYSRPDEWKSKKKDYGPCGVNLQVGNNVCLEAPKFDFLA